MGYCAKVIIEHDLDELFDKDKTKDVIEDILSDEVHADEAFYILYNLHKFYHRLKSEIGDRLWLIDKVMDDIIEEYPQLFEEES